MVRAKVSAIRASQSTSAEEHQQAIASYQDYLQLACSLHTNDQAVDDHYARRIRLRQKLVIRTNYRSLSNDQITL